MIFIFPILRQDSILGLVYLVNISCEKNYYMSLTVYLTKIYTFGKVKPPNLTVQSSGGG